MSKYLLLLLTTTTLFSCQKNDDKVQLTIKVENTKAGQEYTISDGMIYGLEPLFEFQLDETGSFTQSIDLEKPMMIRISGDFYKSVYLEPGQDITINYAQVDNKASYSYVGSGGTKAKYFDDLGSFDRAFGQRHAELKYQQYSLDPETFAKELAEVLALKTNYIDQLEGISEDFEYILRADVFATDITAKVGLENVYNGNKEKGTPDFIFPLHQTYYPEAFSFDERALVSISYSMLIASYINSEIVNQLGDLGDEFWYSDPGNWEKLYNLTVKAEEIPVNFKEHMLTGFLSTLTMNLGIDKAWDIKEDFLTNYPEAKFEKELELVYAKWGSLRKGENAPNFEFESVDGNTVSLNSLKGNVVYIDIWATWCGPCIKQFPSYKQLKERLKNAEDVKWLYVSVDEIKDKKKWLNFLEKNSPGGIQLFGNDGWDSSIMKQYRIQGIPRYLLIDKEGKIYSSSAPLPSSGDVIYEEIQGLRSL